MVSKQNCNRDLSDKTAAVGRWAEPVQELVCRQAWRSPQALAITAGCKSLTYLELESRARLAQHLRSLGVGPGTIVLSVSNARSPRSSALWRS